MLCSFVYRAAAVECGTVITTFPRSFYCLIVFARTDAKVFLAADETNVGGSLCLPKQYAVSCMMSLS